MKPLVPKTDNALLNKLYSDTFPIARRREEVMGYAGSALFGRASEAVFCPAEIALHRLGTQRESLAIPNPSYGQAPDLYLHEYHDVFFAHGVPFDMKGTAIRDGARFSSKRPFIFTKFSDAKVLDDNWGYLPKIKIKNISTIDVPCYLCGVSSDHFGHAVVEEIIALYQLDLVPEAHILSAVKPCDAFIQMAEGLGISRDRIIVAPDACLVKQLFIPTRPRDFYNTAYAAIDIWNRVVECYNEFDGSPNTSVYLSRRNTMNRRLLNEAAVENFFKDYGFEVAYPEELSVPEKVRLLSRAERVVGAVGSTMLNVLFSKHFKTMNTLYLMGWKLLEHAFLESLYGKKYYYVTNPDMRTDTSSNDDWILPLEELDLAMQQWLGLEQVS